jgi:hypothetical protein
MFTFAGLACFLAASTPFIDQVDPLLFFGSGLIYSLFLTFFGVGFALAFTGRVAQLWFLSGVIPLVGMAGFWLSLKVAPEFMSQEIIFRVLPAAMFTLLGVIGVWIAAGFVVAGSGWVRYIRRHRSVSRD